MIDAENISSHYIYADNQRMLIKGNIIEIQREELTNHHQGLYDYVTHRKIEFNDNFDAETIFNFVELASRASYRYADSQTKAELRRGLKKLIDTLS